MKGPLLAALVLLAAPLPARADVLLELRYGHGGHAVAGAATPVTLAVTNREPAAVTVSLEVELPGGDSTLAEAWLGAGAAKDLTVLIRPDVFARPRIVARFDRDVAVALGDRAPSAPTRLTELEPPAGGTVFSTGDLHVLAAGSGGRVLPPAPDGVNAFALPEDHLHDLPLAYDGLDAVYWRNPAEERPPRPETVRALLRWVALGGRLVVSATRRPEALSAAGLAPFLPAEPGPPEPRADYSFVARALLGHRTDPSDGEPPPVGPLVPLRLHPGPGTAGSPVAAEGRLGFGSVAILAFDPARFEGARGALAASVWLAVLGHPDPDPLAGLARLTGDLGDRSALPREADLVSEIARTLRVDTVTPPPMGLISFLLVLYILAVGPLDYYLLRRFRLLHLSALSLLLLAAVFSATIFFLSAWFFSGPPVVNRVTLVDVAPDPAAEGADLVRVEDFACFYAPRGRTVAFEFADPGAIVARLALPDESDGTAGAGFGGGSLRAGPAAGAALTVPFRSARLARSVSIRSEVFPLSVAARPGEPLRVTHGLPFPLYGGALALEGGLLPLAGGPGEPGEPRERLAPLAESILARSVPGFRARSPVVSIAPPAARILARYGLERGLALRSGGRLFAAWTDARDPLGLPGAG
ncbi:MAG: hypothetical protein MUE73_11620, partial [Planctomycetes bacterium]|nr:hypothetical protein [Planctomycetota bacterium]